MRKMASSSVLVLWLRSLLPGEKAVSFLKVMGMEVCAGWGALGSVRCRWHFGQEGLRVSVGGMLDLSSLCSLVVGEEQR